jgi:prepilin-type N-terminal cleavage/methylation domain-containing protein
VTRTACAPRGFTLIELGLVIAVSGVLAMTLVPSLLKRAQAKQAQLVVDQVQIIQEAARWGFVEHPGEPMWLGQPALEDCQGNAGQALLEAGYLAPGALTRNPWSKPYTAAVVEGHADHPGRCHLRVSTEVPDGVHNLFRRSLPAVHCDEPINGMRRCYADIAPPGNPLKLQALENWKRNGSPRHPGLIAEPRPPPSTEPVPTPEIGF